MNLQTLKHFQRVAKAMNNYVAASAYNFRQARQGYSMRAHPQPGFYNNGNINHRFPARMY
ncbi:hypothetical protein I4U23_025858 [Adineta vaga]|nr:hypothetical protein I4U23_025858 [Adineta vaga]